MLLSKQHFPSTQQASKATQPKKQVKQLAKPPVSKTSKSQSQQQQAGSSRNDTLVPSKKSAKNCQGSRGAADATDTQPRSPIDKRRRDRLAPNHGGTAAEGSSASLDRNTKLHLPPVAAAGASRTGVCSDSPLPKSPVPTSAITLGEQSSGSAERSSPVVTYSNGEEGSWDCQEPPTTSDDWRSGNDTESIDDAISKCSTDDDKISEFFALCLVSVLPEFLVCTKTTRLSNNSSSFLLSQGRNNIGPGPR